MLRHVSQGRHVVEPGVLVGDGQDFLVQALLVLCQTRRGGQQEKTKEQQNKPFPLAGIGLVWLGCDPLLFLAGDQVGRFLDAGRPSRQIIGIAGPLTPLTHDHEAQRANFHYRARL